ncbi:hypothetical protein PH547_10130 [Rhizobium sp. CNPSo 3464]|uniref:hypothetical protein n=1 Tax=Rhizobium sp. CNPSo 3464 TaxID=3021406 RepID=UPI00254E0B2E|nr:hypothetical protein [Rhizobium sp. CNPSo 3464]MDK4739237.1 hypothetical protein [Rhizobium sp. CNPSo 3464]
MITLQPPMQSLRSAIYGLIPRPQPSAASGIRPPAKRLLILSRYPNPSVSYYLDERSKALADIPVILKGLDDGLGDVDCEGLFVIICRYIKAPQLRWLEQRHGRLAGVAYFVDDDIPAVIAGDEASWPYKFRLLNFAIRPLPRLNRLLTHLWASTEHLAGTLTNSDHKVDILAPMPAQPSQKSPAMIGETAASLKMVYHATGIHRHEHEFLMPIVRTAMNKHKNLHFEVFADGDLARRWRRQGIEPGRMTVSPQLPWSSYLARTTNHGADIALAPLLAGRTNDSRADTKRIDISRMGAAAIFSRCATFARCAVAGEIHIGNTAEEWLTAIDQLVEDGHRREIAFNATLQSLEKMRQSATLAFPGIRFDGFGDTA